MALEFNQTSNEELSSGSRVVEEGEAEKRRKIIHMHVVDIKPLLRN